LNFDKEGKTEVFSEMEGLYGRGRYLRGIGKFKEYKGLSGGI